MDKTRAILLMGGTGERFGSQMPKQFHRLSGKKIYLHTLETFLESHLFEEIILVTPENWINEVLADVRGMTGVKVIKGGSSRQESSFLGLLACDSETSCVVIHDAVRPFVTKEILIANVEGAKAYGAVDTCISSADTIVHQGKDKHIAAIPNRSEYLRGQTPQSFAYPLILEAHQKAAGTQASDDCQLVLAQGKKVAIVFGDESNIKITTELDLFLAEQLFRLKRPQRETAKTSLKGKKFAITGGTGGIGQAICTSLENLGAKAILISRGASVYPANLTSPKACEAIFEQIYQIEGPLDGLINSLGKFHLKEVDALSPDEIEELIAVNLTGLIFSCKYVKIKEKGHIINIASSSYSRGRRNFAIYSSAKAAVVNFTQGLSEERNDLCVNAVVPQRTNTCMRRACFPNEDVSTLLSPEQVANAIIELLQQTDVTGSIVDVAMKEKRHTAPASTEQSPSLL